MHVDCSDERSSGKQKVRKIDYGRISFYSGNVVGQLPYTPGTPCTKCASGQGWCYKNLCSEYIQDERFSVYHQSLGVLCINSRNAY